MKKNNLIYTCEKVNMSRLALYSFFCFFIFSCKGFITVDSPKNKISDKNIFSNDETAIAMVTNIYTQLNQDCKAFNGDGRLMNVALVTGLSSDELVLYGSNNTSFYQIYTNTLNGDNTIYTWSDIYRKIYNVNSAIASLIDNHSLSDNVRRQLLGEVKFIRAFCYFYLTNLYGNVPIVLGIDPLINSTLSQSSKEEVYTQILEDLKDAESLMSESYLAGNLIGTSIERVRPTKWVATALLARVSLFMLNYANAENEADLLINHQELFKLDSLDDVFLKSSNECIWQIQNVYNSGANTGDGQTFILPQSGPDGSNYPVYLSDYIVNDFEAGDLRKRHWIDSITTNSGITYFFPFKYKSGALTENGSSSEYIMMFRLAEQYLIRAEARLKLGKYDQAISDINIIRRRAGLNNITTIPPDSILKVISHERKVELFTEWGHRWLDLKRTGDVNSIMSVVAEQKGVTWQSYYQLYPINNSELLADKSLIQNPGY